MTPRDLIITPILIILIMGIAFWLRSFITTRTTRKFFIPALVLKIAGALAVGLIYQFYYDGGDTFTYFNLGSVHIYEAFLDSPSKGFSLIFGPDSYSAETYEYASRIYTFGDKHSYFVVRVAGLFSLFTLNTYSAIAVLFAVLSFTGMWSMFVSLNKAYPGQSWFLALSILFVPSVVFWGSGLLKDTLTIGALGWMTWGAINIFRFQDKWVKSIVAILLSAFVVYIIKIYILLCILPAVLFWVLLSFNRSIKSQMVRILVFPIAIIMVAAGGYYTIVILGNTSHRYSLDKFNYTAESTAKWNYYVSQQEGGSGYTIGDATDFSTGAMLGRAPEAIWIALYRPYFWEADNIVMFLSGVENLILILLSVFVLVRVGLNKGFRILIDDPFVFFSLLFVFAFAFAIGVSTYNFGALVRYKIPLIPFFLSALFIMYNYSKRERNKAELLATE